MNNLTNFKLIEDYKNKNNLTVKQFCEKCKINENIYYKIKNNKNVLISSYFKIARTISVPIHMLFS